MTMGDISRKYPHNAQTDQNIKEAAYVEEFKVEIQEHYLNDNGVKVQEVVDSSLNKVVLASEYNLQVQVKNEAEFDDEYRRCSLKREIMNCDSKKSKQKLCGEYIDINGGNQTETCSVAIKQEFVDFREHEMPMQEYDISDSSSDVGNMRNNLLNEAVYISEYALQVKSEIDSDDIAKGCNLKQEVIKCDFEQNAEKLDSYMSMQTNEKSCNQNESHAGEGLITFGEDSRRVFKKDRESSIYKNQKQVENNFENHSIKISNSEEQRFQCNFCEHKTKYKHDLIRHFNSRHNKRGSEVKNQQIHHCKVCERKYKHKKSLKVHIYYKHNDSVEWLYCDLCKYRTKRKSYLASHKMNHNKNPEMYECQFCECKFENTPALEEHIKSNHNENAELFQCNFCNFKTKYKKFLVHHFKMDHSASFELYQCCFCECTYKYKYALKRHVFYKHNENAKWYQCNFCDYKTKRRYSLVIHLEQHKVNREIYHCQICGFKSKYKYNLRRHMNENHNNTKAKESSETYQCQFCEYKSKYKHSLNRHIYSKHNENPTWYQCSCCDYKTKHKLCLKRHFKIYHENSEMHYCQICEYKSKYKNRLERHIDYNHNENATWYQCSFCNYKTKYKLCLKKHSRIHHDQNSEVSVL